MTENIDTPAHHRWITRFLLRSFTPVGLLLIGLGGWSVHTLLDAQLSKIRSEQAAVVATRAALILEAVDNDLEKLLAIAAELSQLLEANPLQLRPGIEQSFQTLLRRNRAFAEVRWIDQNGQESVRVSRHPNATQTGVDAAQQGRAQQDHVRQTLDLAPGQVAISALGLHHGPGRAGSRLIPILRFGTPVRDGQNRPRGIVVIDVDASRLLDKLPRRHFTGSTLIWLDDGGDWLRAPDPNDEWRAALGLPGRFPDRHPDVWRSLGDSRLSSFSNAHGLWTTRLVDLRSGEFGHAVGQAPQWWLISLIPADALAAIRLGAMLRFAPLVLVSLLLSAWFLYQQARRGLALADRTAALERTETNYQALFESAFDAHLIFERGGLIDINPAGLRLLGAGDRAQLRGKALGELLNGAGPTGGERELVALAERTGHAEADWPARRLDDGRDYLVHVSLNRIAGSERALLLAVMRDITEHRAQAARLEALAERLRATVDAALDCIIVMDRQGLIVEFNPAAERCFGHERSAVIGRLLAEVIIPERYRQRHQAGLQHYLASGEGPVLRHRIEIEALRADGSEFPIELAIDVAHGDSEELFVAYLRDITERRRAEAELRETRERYRRLVEDIGSDYLLFSHQAGTGILNYVSSSMEAIFGIPREAVLGQPWMKAVEWLPGSVEKGLEAVQQLLAGSEQGGTVELAFRHPDGTDRTVLVTQHLVRDAEGRPEAIEGLVMDITERKRTQEMLQQHRRQLEQLVEVRTRELRHHERLLDAIVKTTPNGLLLIDERGNICMTNTALDEMFGYSPAELIGQPVEKLVPEPSRERHRDLREQYQRDPVPRSMGSGLDLRGQRKDGTYLDIDVSLAKFSVNDRDYIQATVADITARKRAEAALRDLTLNLERKVEDRTRELAAASAAKSEFLANMSHEIRTPMNGILGLAQLLEREELTPEQRDMVDRIRQAGRSLLAILNDILDFSKIEAGQLRIDPRPFSLPPLLAQIESLLGNTAHSKGLEFSVEIPPLPPGGLIGDALRLEQILTNLIGNAIKFTEHGEVRLRIKPLSTDERWLRLRFEVCDTGIGIAEAQRAALFAPFTQADSSITRRFGGTGLGLSICKRLVELMGGEIGVDSKLGVGSTFWFELPFERCATLEPQSVPSAAPAVADGPRLTGVRCLVVDDSRMNRDVVERMLRREGAIVSLAVDGQQALQYLDAEGSEFDVVLMDVQMPVLDGLAATRALRADSRFQRLPVIALTAGVLAEQREQARAAGYDDFVAKPVDLEELVAVILRWTTLAEPVLAGPAAERPTAFPTIPGLDTVQAATLLGDDRELFIDLLQQFMEEFGDAAAATATDLASGERDRAARRLHGLRGAASYLGATELQQSAQALEQAILADGELESLLGTFQQAFARVRAAITAWQQRTAGGPA